MSNDKRAEPFGIGEQVWHGSRNGRPRLGTITGVYVYPHGTAYRIEESHRPWLSTYFLNVPPTGIHRTYDDAVASLQSA